MLTAADHELRANAIGSSEAAAILGIGPGSAFEVWTRLVAPELATRQPTLAMRKGVVMEPLIAELYAERFGVQLRECRTMLHPELPFICTSLDREIVDAAEGDAQLVEIKAPTFRTDDDWGPDGSDVFPLEYLVQVTLQLRAKGWRRGHLAALIEGDSEIRVYPIDFDAELAAQIEASLTTWFRRHVLTGEPPPIDGSPAASRFLSKRFPKSNGQMLVPDAETLLLAEELARVGRELKTLAARKLEITNHLKARCADFDGIEGVCTYRQSRTGKGRVQWKALAGELGPSREQISKHTKAPTRTFRFLGEEPDDDNGEEAA